VSVELWTWHVAIPIFCEEFETAIEICIAILVAEISMILWFEQFWADGTSKSHWIDIWILVVCIVKVGCGTLFD